MRKILDIHSCKRMVFEEAEEISLEEGKMKTIATMFTKVKVLKRLQRK